jgi:hypothetical protein
VQGRAAFGSRAGREDHETTKIEGAGARRRMRSVDDQSKSVHAAPNGAWAWAHTPVVGSHGDDIRCYRLLVIIGTVAAMPNVTCRFRLALAV